jgi:outer membrane protein OmpA-like peptidoglycan-associated protein
MNNQMQELEQSLARERELGDAVVESSDNKEGIKVSIGNRTAFSAGSDEIKPSFRDALDRISKVLIRYPKTSLMIVGHTDSQGATDYNQLLSERRAKALSDYLCAKGIDSTRVRYVGKGATEPVASNATAAGRSVNARLEILVRPLPVLSGR